MIENLGRSNKSLRHLAKHTLVYPCKGILISNKKEQTTDKFNRLDGLQEHHTEWKITVLKGYMFHDSIYVIFSK